MIPRDDETEDDVKAAEAGGHERVAGWAGAANDAAPSAMNTSPMTCTTRTESVPAVAIATP